MAAFAVVALAQSGAVAAQDTSPSPTPSRTPAPIGQTCTFTHRPFDAASIHLTGAWGANDGGVYYIRQHGSDVAWNGMSNRLLPVSELGREWNNVALGKLGSDGVIQLDWMDVPRGNILGGGTLTFKAQADPKGELELVKTDETGTGFGGETFRPCQADALAPVRFKPAFSIRDDIGIGLGSYEFGGAFGVYPGDPYDSGITAWDITPESAWSCDPSTSKLKPGAAAFVAWLTARSDLQASNPVPSTVGGLPATSVDVKGAPGAKACMDGAIRLWRTYGSDAGLGAGVTTRVVVMDVGDQVVAFEIWGFHQDRWLDLAAKLLDTVAFTTDAP